MSYKLTGGWQVKRQLQYVEEATYGTTPTSPTLIHAGPIVDLSDSQETQATKYRQVGSRDIYAMIKTGELYSFDVTFNPLDEFLLEYAINLPETGTRNIGKSLSFVKSSLINNTEMYTIYTGAIADSIDISITAESAVEVTISYICKSISTPSTSHGLGTPVWATNPTQIPWTNTTPGANPFTWNTNADGTIGSGRVVDTPSFSTSVTNNVERVKINGDNAVKFVEPTLRDITFEFDTLHAFTDLIADQKALTERHFKYHLSNNRRLRYNSGFLESMTMADSTGSTTPKTESYTGTAKAIFVESY